MTSGTLYLIPVPLGNVSPEASLPAPVTISGCFPKPAALPSPTPGQIWWPWRKAKGFAWRR
mgnify:CR=1 FL=1